MGMATATLRYQKYWEHLPDNDRTTIYKDLKEALLSGRDMGDPCDINEWLSFWEWIKAKLIAARGKLP